MLRRRCHRCCTAFLVVLSLLFSQLALASYVCPVSASAEAMAAMIEAGQPCNGMDEQQPALCHAHSAPEAKAFEATKLPVLAQPAIVQVLALAFEIRACTTGAVRTSVQADGRPPPGPLFLATLRLRV